MNSGINLLYSNERRQWLFVFQSDVDDEFNDETMSDTRREAMAKNDNDYG